jgi:hypothetical protein
MIMKNVRALVVAGFLVTLSGCSLPGHAAGTDLTSALLRVPADANATGHEPRDISVADAADMVRGKTPAAEVQKELASAGYQHGATEQWIEPDNTVVTVVVMQFDNETTPVSDCLSFDSFRRRNPRFTGGADISGTSHGRVYLLAAPNESQQWESDGVFAKGNAVGYLFLSGTIWFGPERLVELAQAQYARLP